MRSELSLLSTTQKRVSVFPFSPDAINAVKHRPAGFALSKGTIRFSAAAPIPDDVLSDAVRFRVEQISHTG